VGEPARVIDQKTTVAQSQTIDQKEVEKVLKDLQKLTDESMTAYASMAPEGTAHKLKTVNGSLTAARGKIGMVVGLYSQKDPFKEYRRHIKEGNRLAAEKSRLDFAKLVLETIQTGLKANIDLAIIIAERDGLVDSVASLKKISEKIGYIGKLASVIGIASNTIDMVDAIRKREPERAINASIQIVEGLVTLFGGPPALGMALTAPLKMVLVAGKLGGMLILIREVEIRKRTEEVVKKGDQLFKKAKVLKTYRNHYFQLLMNNNVPAKEIQLTEAIMNDWGRVVADCLIELRDSMAAMETWLHNKVGSKGYTKEYEYSMDLKIQNAADSIDNSRDRWGRRIFSGPEMVQNWSLVQEVLDTTIRFTVTRLMEAKVLNFTRAPAEFATMKRIWAL